MNLVRPHLALPELKLFRTRGLATLLTGFTAIAALVLLAYWTSRLISPRPVAALPASTEAPRSAGSEQDMVRLFGVQAGGLESNVDGLALTGVFAPHDGRGGFATFRTAKGGAGVTIGQEITPGVRLERVEAARVVVSSGGRERILELPAAKIGGSGVANTPKVEAKAKPKLESESN